MASKAKAGRGTVVSIGGVTGSAAAAFTPIEELLQANFSGAKWGTTDVSSFDSGVDDEFISNMRDNGNLAMKGNLIDGAAGQAALNAAYNSGEKYDFKVQLKPGPGQATGTLYSFSALVDSFFDITVDVKNAVQFSSSLKISGGITVTPGA